MKHYLPLLLIFMSGCTFHQRPVTMNEGLQELKHELGKANIHLSQQQEYIAQLEETIASKEIARIQREVEELNQQDMAKLLLSSEQGLEFFYQQREILWHIIHNHPICRVEAQEVLDQILTFITQISDANFE